MAGICSAHMRDEGCCAACRTEFEVLRSRIAELKDALRSMVTDCDHRECACAYRFEDIAATALRNDKAE